MHSIQWKDLLEARCDFRRTWPQLLLADLFARIIGVVILTPVVGLLIQVFLLRSDDGVLSDTDIIVFLFHPIGITAFLIVCSISLGILFAEQSVLMVIGFGATEDKRITWLDAIRYVIAYAHELVKLAGYFIVRVLLISVPFLAGVGGVYLLFLTKHDINFYLTVKPLEFWWAIAITGMLMTVLTVIVLKKVAGWILAIPLILFENTRGGKALQQSEERVAVFGWKVALLIAAWLVMFVLISGFITGLVSLIGSTLVSDLSGNFALVVSGLGLTLMIVGLGNLSVMVLSTALFPLLIVRLYRSLKRFGRLKPKLASQNPLGEKASINIPGKAIFGLGAIALVVVVIGGYIFSRSIEEKNDIEIIAHRGASGAAPENTMAAFQQAIIDKADWIELDVQENADNVIVVAHDSDFLKVARRDLTVWEATNENLKNLDIGRWFAPEYSDQRVPTLRQVLELAKGKLGVVIELKYYGHDRNLESRVVDIVEQTDMEPDIMIMSLKLDGMHKITALRPAWKRGLLNTASIGDLTRLDLDFLALNTMAASRAMIRRAHERGMKVYVWTVNDSVQMSVMMSRGVDGIITDEPAMGRRVMELRKELSPLGRLVVWIAGEIGLLRGADQYSIEADA